LPKLHRVLRDVDDFYL